MRVFALLLLLTVPLGAQVVDENELTYGPIEGGPRDPSFSITVANHGLLLAWSEVDPETRLSAIRVGLLDFNAQLVGEIRTIPARIDNVHATTPVVATDGTNFLLVWLERQQYTYVARRAAGVFLDATGAPSSEIRLFGAATNGPPSLVFDGAVYRLYNNASYIIAPDGSTQIDRNNAARRVPFATGDAHGWVTWTNRADEPPVCFFRCSSSDPFYRLNWTVITEQWIRSGQHGETNYSGPAPAVIADDNDLLIIWASSNGLSAMEVEDAVAGKPFRLTYPVAAVSPSAAGPLVVFEQKGGDIYGSIIENGEFGAPFPISTGVERDSLPRVYRIGDRYLVTYLREHTSSSVSLVGRFVTISP